MRIYILNIAKNSNAFLIAHKYKVLQVFVAFWFSDLFLLHSFYTIITFTLYIIFIDLVYMFRVSQRFILWLALVMVCLIPFTHILHMSVIAEKLGIWIYLILLVYLYKSLKGAHQPLKQ